MFDFTIYSSDLYLQVQFLLWWLSFFCDFSLAAVASETSAELTVVLRVTELSVLEEAIPDGDGMEVSEEEMGVVIVEVEMVGEEAINYILISTSTE